MTKILAPSSACNSSNNMALLGTVNNIIAIFAICLFTPAAALALSLDLPGAYFKSGRPIEGETLRDALDPAHAAESLNNLEITAGRLAKYSGTHFDVAGHADTNECEGSECRYLSSRRAQLVFRHLLKLGVDPMRLDGLAGWGTSALVSEPRPEDTWRNRRVDINVSN